MPQSGSFWNHGTGVETDWPLTKRGTVRVRDVHAARSQREYPDLELKPAPTMNGYGVRFPGDDIIGNHRHSQN